MPPVIIGAAIVGAATVGAAAVMSSGTSRAAKTQAEAQQAQISAQQQAAEQERVEREKIVEQERVERGKIVEQERVEREKAAVAKEEAVRNIKYPTYLETTTADLLRRTLEEKIAGRGLVAPVSPLDIDKTTAPFAAQRRAGLKQTGAVISSETSGRGLGRSTIPISQMGEQSLAVERDIEQRVADLQIQNKEIEQGNIERERVQKESAFQGYENLTGAESLTQREKARFEREGIFNVADTRINTAQAIADTRTNTEQAIANTRTNTAQAFRENQFSIASTIAERGATEAANQLRQTEIWSSALQGLAQTASQTTQSLIDKIGSQQKPTGARVNLGPGTTSYGIKVPSRHTYLRY